MSNRSDLADFGSNLFENVRGPNLLINGNFDIWQRNTSQTTNNRGSDDRWANYHNGSTKTHSRQTFVSGQTIVPGNPRYYSRTVVSSVAGASNYVIKAYAIENVLFSSSNTFTLSFYAKASADLKLGIEFLQYFAGGSTTIVGSDFIGGAQSVQLGTTWQYYKVTVTYPSLTGKTIGTPGSDWFGFYLWFDAGSSYAARTNNIGQQSGTFDIARVQFEEGTVATPFKERPIADEWALCRRYFQTNYIEGEPIGTANATGPFTTQMVSSLFPVTGGALACVTFNGCMRATPSIGIYNNSTGTASNVRLNGTTNISGGYNIYIGSSNGFTWANAGAATTQGDWIQFMWTAEAEL